jgi:hypothetical protein
MRIAERNIGDISLDDFWREIQTDALKDDDTINPMSAESVP